MDKQIYNIIMKTIVNFNNENPEYKIDVSKGIQTPLYGAEDTLDSLGLVTLVVSIEQDIEDELGKTIKIVSPKAMSQTTSPFLTIDTLVKFIVTLIEESE